MRIPMMRMGLIGFFPQEQEYLGNVLRSRSVTLHWQQWPFMEADALWVNGAHVQPVRHDLVRVPSGDPTSRATQLNLKEVDRPTAFSLPLAAGIKVPYTFDPHSAESIAAVLAKFEAWLQPLAVQLALSEAMYVRRGSFTSPVYHLTRSGLRIGIVDLHGDAALAPGLRSADVLQAEWSGRPEGAKDAPSSFQRISVAELMWQHVSRTGDDLLPQRYRKGTIYFRRPPKVAQRLIKDAHLVLLRELASLPQTFEQLQAHTGIGATALARELAALYFGGSITTDAKRAVVMGARGATGGHAESSRPGPGSSLLDSDSRFRPNPDAPPPEWTVPAALNRDLP